MIEELDPSPVILDQQPAQPVRTIEALLRLYAQGYRNFSGSDLRGITLNSIDDKEVKYLDLREIILKGSKLTGIDLFKSQSLKVDLTGSDFSNCDMQGVRLSYCKLDQCNFSNSILKNADLSDSSCRGSDFIAAIVQNISFGRMTDFTASNFIKADFRSSTISGNFSHSKFFGSNFYKASLYQVNASGSDFSNSNFHQATFNGFQSDGSNFSGCNFHKANAESVRSQKSDFSDADLRWLKFNGDIRYSFYNSKTKFSEDFDPMAVGMELLEDESVEKD